MKESEFNPSFPTIPVLIVVIISGAAAFALGVFNIPAIYEGLRTGHMYSFGVIFDNKHLIDRNSSPMAYWVMAGFHVLGVLFSIGLGVMAPMMIIVAYVKRLVREKKEREG